MFKFDVYLHFFKLSITVDEKKYNNCVTGFDIIHATV